MRVQVVYARPLTQDTCFLDLADGTTVEQALTQTAYACDLADRFFAIYGRPVSLDTILRDGDRLEILRALRVDPKEARRRRQSHRSNRSKPLKV